MSGSDEQYHAENIASRNSEIILPYGEPIHTYSKDALFSNVFDWSEKYIKSPKCSCVSNNCSECPAFFVIISEINGYKTCTFYLFSLISIKLLDIVVCTNSSYLITLKLVLNTLI